MRLNTLSPLLRRAIAYAHDLTITTLSLPFAYFLRMGFETPISNWPSLAFATLIIVGASLMIYPLVGLNRGSWRYASSRDMLAIIKAASLVVLVSITAIFLFSRLHNIPRSLPIIHWFVLIVALAGPRLFYRIMKDTSWDRIRFRSKKGMQRRIAVFLYGFTDEADTFIRAMQRGKKNLYRPVAIFEQKSKHKKRHLHGIPVMGTIDNLPSATKTMSKRGIQVQRLIITKPDLPKELLTDIIKQASNAGLEVDFLPSMNDVNHFEEGTVPEPKALRLEDLLGRDPVQLDMEAIATMITNKKILITGAGGSIGSELCRFIQKQKPNAILCLDSSEYNLYALEQELKHKENAERLHYIYCDVREKQRVLDIMHAEKPEIIFHAAALKHVPLVEDNPLEGIKTNIIGTQNVADCALEAKAQAFIMISTDKAVNPTNIMGATKRFAEAYCQALDMQDHGTRFLTVRFGNVLGSRGSVVPLFEKQLRQGGPITLTHKEIERYFMTIPEAVQLVLQASSYGLYDDQKRGRIFVLDMGKPVKIMDLALNVIRLAGLRPYEDIKIEITGLRPGEKLYEELFDLKEPPLKTPAKGVLAAQPRIVDFTQIQYCLNAFKTNIKNHDINKAIKTLSTIVPEFQHAQHNSKTNIIPLENYKNQNIQL